MSKVYNINEMKRALQKVYEEGNRRAISKKLCEELDITEGYFQMYLNQIEKCFNAVCKYIRVKNSPTATEKQCNNARDAIYPHWKGLLECGEESKFKKMLHCTEHDISNLVGFCQRFMNEANNVCFEKDFVAKKTWSTSTLTAFRKKVETDIGIRMAQIAVLSDEERDFLTEERRLLNRIRKAMKKVEKINMQIDILYKSAAQSRDAMKAEVYHEQINELQGVIRECEVNIAQMKNELASVQKVKKAG